MAKTGIWDCGDSAHERVLAKLWLHPPVAVPETVFSDVSRWPCCLPACQVRCPLGLARLLSMARSDLDIACRSRADPEHGVRAVGPP